MSNVLHWGRGRVVLPAPIASPPQRCGTVFHCLRRRSMRARQPRPYDDATAWYSIVFVAVRYGRMRYARDEGQRRSSCRGVLHTPAMIPTMMATPIIDRIALPNDAAHCCHVAHAAVRCGRMRYAPTASLFRCDAWCRSAYVAVHHSTGHGAQTICRAYLSLGDTYSLRDIRAGA